MLISTALLLDSIIRNSVCTIAVPPGGGGIVQIHLYNGYKFQYHSEFSNICLVP
jgi:hypothetical protein